MNYIKQRSVVFVDEDYNLLAGLFISCPYQIREPVIVVFCRTCNAIPFLIFNKAIAYIAFQLVLLHVLAGSHAYAQHGIFRPFLLHAVYVETLEQFPPPLKIRLQRGDKQGLAEPARTAQEDIFAEMYHIPDILSLVDIQTVQFLYFGECLYAYRQTFQFLLFHIFTVACFFWGQS